MKPPGSWAAPRRRRAFGVRSLVALAVVLAGAALIVYGDAVHTVTVLTERERTIEVPQDDVLPSPFAPPMEPELRRVTVKEEMAVERSEPYVVRLVALGGLQRRASGEIIEMEVQ